MEAAPVHVEVDAALMIFPKNLTQANSSLPDANLSIVVVIIEPFIAMEAIEVDIRFIGRPPILNRFPIICAAVRACDVGPAQPVDTRGELPTSGDLLQSFFFEFFHSHFISPFFICLLFICCFF